MPINVGTETNQATLLAKPLTCSTVHVFLVFSCAFLSSHICIRLLEGEFLIIFQPWGGFHWAEKVVFGADVVGSPVRTVFLLFCLKTQRLTFVHMPWHFWTKSTPFKSESYETDQCSRRHTLGIQISPLRLCEWSVFDHAHAVLRVNISSDREATPPETGEHIVNVGSSVLI